MIYPYFCRHCTLEFEVIKPLSLINQPEICPSCGSSDTDRYIARTHFYGTGTEDAEYNPAFGEVVRNSHHRNKLAKERGMIEVGTESLSTLEKIETDREKRLAKSYDELTSTSLKLVSNIDATS